MLYFYAQASLVIPTICYGHLPVTRGRGVGEGGCKNGGYAVSRQSSLFLCPCGCSMD